MAEVGNISENVSSELFFVNISENVSSEPPFASVLGVPGYTAFVTVPLIVLVPLQLFLTIITIAGLCAGKEFRKIKTQRNIMIAMVAMAFVSSIDMMVLATAEYSFLHHHQEAGAIFCRGALLVRHIDYVLRDILLVFFSVLVFIAIKHGHNVINLVCFNVALFILVLIALPLGTVYLFPSAVNFSDPLDGVSCSIRGDHAAIVVYVLILVLIFIPTRVITIGIVIASLVFVKKHINTLTDSKKLKMAMIKFVAILVILNALFVVGGLLLVTILIIRSVIRITYSVVIWHLLYFFFRNIPPILTPLLMIAVFQPLRVAIKTLFLPLCRGDRTEGVQYTPRKTSGTSQTSKCDIECCCKENEYVIVLD